MSRFLKVRNFERFQHYRDRRPPWIKLYRDLWNDPRFFDLAESDRYFLISFFIIASQNDNKVPANEKWLKREMATQRAIPIEALVDSGWLEVIVEHDASTLLPPYPETERETERETENIYAHGEFGYARMTAKQHENLKAKLNGKTEAYISRFDNWVAQAPDAKDKTGIRRRDRHAYPTILNWFSRDGGQNEPKRE